MYQIRRAERNGRTVVRQNVFSVGETNLEYLTFPLLEETGVVKHLFTTRTGGVSRDIFSTMNLSFHRGDDGKCVLENYRRIGLALGIRPEDMVLSQQTHTTNIRRVTAEDAGKGITRPLDYEEIDGLVTDVEGLALVTSYADCVPLYFVDPDKHVIGLAHSGWRGTVERMGAHMVERMRNEFGCDPKNIRAAIGPSICQDCYEVSGDVAERFLEAFGEESDFQREFSESGYQGGTSGRYRRMVEPGEKPDKYQLDLWRANLIVLRSAGITPEHIAVTDICTCHNSEYLFSHRASQGKRGNLCAFLMLLSTGE